MSREMAQKVIVPKKKKLMSQSFLNSGTLVILCLFATMGPQLCPKKKNYVPKFLKQRDIGNFMSFCNHGPSIMSRSFLNLII